MKKLLKLINVRDLVTNVAAAAIILTLIACGGPKGMVPGIVGATNRVVQLIHIPNSGHRIMPNSGKTCRGGFVCHCWDTESACPIV